MCGKPDLAAFEALDKSTKRWRKNQANRIFTLLRRVLNHAWERQKVSDDRVWRRIKRYKVENLPAPVILQPDETRKLLRTCGPDMEKLVKFALMTGASLLEAIEFKVGWFDDEFRIARILNTENLKARRFVVSIQAAAALKPVVEQAIMGGVLFPRSDGQMWSARIANQKFLRARNAAGLPKDIRFRTLKDTYAHNLLSAGLPAPVVARQIGSSLSVVLDRYGGTVDDMIDREIRQHYPFHFDSCGEALTSSESLHQHAHGKVGQ